MAAAKFLIQLQNALKIFGFFNYSEEDADATTPNDEKVFYIFFHNLLYFFSLSNLFYPHD